MSQREGERASSKNDEEGASGAAKGRGVPGAGAMSNSREPVSEQKVIPRLSPYAVGILWIAQSIRWMEA